MTELSAPIESTGGTTPTATRSYRPWVPGPDFRRPVLVDLLAAGVLGLLVVNAFDPAFGGMLWLTVGGAGIAAGLLVAFLTVQFKTSPITTVIATLVGFFALGAIAVPDTAIAGVIPGPGTPTALFDGITHGWARLLTTNPPVGTVDHLAAIVYLGGFITAGGGLQVARRTRSTWLPLLPALLVEFAAILIGTHSPASTLAQGAGVAIVAISWASLRGARVRLRVHVVGSNALTRRITAAAFVVIVLGAGMLVAKVEPFASANNRYVLRDHTQPPFDPNNYPSPLAGYPAWRAQAQPKSTTLNQTIMTVRGLPADVPVRVAVMDVYDGTVWLVGGTSDAQDRSGSGQFLRVGSDLTASAIREPGQSIRSKGPATRASLSVSLDHYNDVWVPGVSGLQAMTSTSTAGADVAASLRFNQVTDSAAIPSGVGGGTTIHEQAEVPVASYVGNKGTSRDRIVGDEPADPSVDLPDVADTSGQQNKITLKGEADRLIGGAPTDYAKAKALETALTKSGQAYFSDGLTQASTNALTKFRSGHNLYQLEQFLGAVNPNDPTKSIFVGNAERYAAAMAAMARTEGLPARVVVGFRANANDKVPAKVQDGVTTFTADQADAWVEIAFKDVGWVAFYPTPPRSQKDLPTQKLQQQSSKPADVQAQPPVSPPPNPVTLQDQVKHSNDKANKSSSSFHIPAWVWLILKIICYPLILIAAVVGAITGYKRWRTKRRRTWGSPVDRVSGAWAEMLDQLRDLGTTVPRKGTRLEVAGGIPAEKWDQMIGFAAGIDAAMFGPDDPDDESVSSLWDYVEAERVTLLSALERKRRWIAQVNLSSLKPWR